MAKNSSLFIELGSGFSMMLGLPRIATWKTESRPTNARRGTLGFNLETKNLEYYNGSNWYGASMSEA